MSGLYRLQTESSFPLNTLCCAVDWKSYQKYFLTETFSKIVFKMKLCYIYNKQTESFLWLPIWLYYIFNFKIPYKKPCKFV